MLEGEGLADSVLRQAVGVEVGLGASSLLSWHLSLGQRKNSRHSDFCSISHGSTSMAFAAEIQRENLQSRVSGLFDFELVPSHSFPHLALLVHGHFLKKQW